MERWSCRGQSSKRKHPRPHRVLKIIFEKNSFVVVVVFTELFFSLFLLLLLLVLSLSFGSFFLCLLGFLPVFFFLCFPLLLVSGRSYRVFFSLIFFATKKNYRLIDRPRLAFLREKLSARAAVLPSFTEFYRVLPSFIIYFSLPIRPGSTRFSWIKVKLETPLSSFTGFYRVLLDLTGFYRVFTEFYLVLTRFYRV